ncbi:hypothetical protein BDZ89DRAFT_575066 [Hymenopellis radicata]|nr:hypothetical protein BDZ89DRAFT_575066 [Hymenopellis radicata]
MCGVKGDSTEKPKLRLSFRVTSTYKASRLCCTTALPIRRLASVVKRYGRSKRSSGTNSDGIGRRNRMLLCGLRDPCACSLC